MIFATISSCLWPKNVIGQSDSNGCSGFEVDPTVADEDALVAVVEDVALASACKSDIFIFKSNLC